MWGQLVDQQISADDVTDRIVNFESRIITAEASVLRLRKFLEEATNIDNVALLERELLNRETDLETLRGQLRTLQDQVSLATITLTINQLPEPPIVLPDTELFVAAWVSSADDDPMSRLPRYHRRARRHCELLPRGRELGRGSAHRCSVPLRDPAPSDPGWRVRTRTLSRPCRATSTGLSPAICSSPPCPSPS